MHRPIGLLRGARIERRFSLVNERDENVGFHVFSVRTTEREKSRSGFMRRDELDASCIYIRTLADLFACALVYLLTHLAEQSTWT